MQLGKRHFKLRGKEVIASLLVALVLLLDALAACPSLHELIHKDAGLPEHQCGVTLFAHGQVDSAVVDVPVVAAAIVTETTPHIVFSVFSPAIKDLPAGRAPPVLPAVS
ncbi:MAG: hypothetical protein P4N60_24715 [Verrucomicrobiae bacterium]|nr:hypothetical protein [Verrucomicrobiae bacterium]